MPKGRLRKSLMLIRNLMRRRRGRSLMRDIDRWLVPWSSKKSRSRSHRLSSHLSSKLSRRDLWSNLRPGTSSNLPNPLPLVKCTLSNSSPLWIQEWTNMCSSQSNICQPRSPSKPRCRCQQCTLRRFSHSICSHSYLKDPNSRISLSTSSSSSLPRIPLIRLQHSLPRSAKLSNQLIRIKTTLWASMSWRRCLEKLAGMWVSIRLWRWSGGTIGMVTGSSSSASLSERSKAESWMTCGPENDDLCYLFKISHMRSRGEEPFRIFKGFGNRRWVR